MGEYCLAFLLSQHRSEVIHDRNVKTKKDSNYWCSVGIIKL